MKKDRDNLLFKTYEDLIRTTTGDTRELVLRRAANNENLTVQQVGRLHELAAEISRKGDTGGHSQD